MGVQGLWKLIEPCGRMVPLETMSHKVLAVDVSIWLHQAMKGMHDVRGAPVAIAHLLVLFHRLCKLLFYKIRPVFVFDGGVPTLKRNTMATRRTHKTAAKSEAEKVRGRLLKNILKHEALRNVLADGAASAVLGLTSFNLPGPSEEEDLYKLPAIATQASDSNSSDSGESSVEEDGEEHIDIHSLDIKSDSFKALPAEIRHEILSELQDTRKQNSWRHLDDMPNQSQDFSNFQMNRLLKRRAVQVSLEEAGKEMGARDVSLKELQGLLGEGFVGGSVQSGRIAQEDTTRFMLIQKPKPSAATVQIDEKKNSLIDKSKGFDITDHLEEVQWSDTSDTDTELRDLSERGHVKVEDELSQEEFFNIQAILEEGVISTKKSNENLENCSNLKRSDTVVKTEEEIIVDNSVNNKSNIVILPKNTQTAEANNEMVAGVVIKAEKMEFEDILEVLEDRESDRNSEVLTTTLTETRESISPKREIQEQNVPASLPVSIRNKTTNESNDPSVEKTVVESFNVIPMIEGPPKKTDKVASTNEIVSTIEILPAGNTTTVEKEQKLSNLTEVGDATHSAPFSTLSEPDSSKRDTNISIVPEESDSHSKKENTDESEGSAEKIAEITEKPCLEIAREQSEISLESIQEDRESDSDDDFVPVTDSPPKYPSPPRKQETKLDDVTSQKEEWSPQPGPSKRVLVTDEGLRDFQESLEYERKELLREKGRQERLAQNMDDQVYADAQELLRLFGVPYIIAPMEAEAQCAALEILGLTEGTITDDSDIWLFGGRTVYKNFFNQKQRVLEFRCEDIREYYKLNREDLIKLALLVGSDYTQGLPGIGPVTAMEVLAAFPSPTKTEELLVGLQKFRDWVKSGFIVGPTRVTLKNKVKNTSLIPGFPSQAVVDAYLNPEVDHSKEPFSWSKPNVHLLQDYTKKKFGWSTERCNELIMPIMKKLMELTDQTTMEKYFRTAPKPTPLEGRVSKRIEGAVKRLGGAVEDDEEPSAPKLVTSRTKKPKQTKETKQQLVRPTADALTLRLHQELKIPQREIDKMKREETKRKAAELLKSNRGRGRGRGRNIPAPIAPKKEVKLSESSSDDD